MPDDATNAALVSTAGQTISTAGNIAASATMNKATRKWNEQQRDIQRGWALADWAAQNEYNSPKQQRERMVAAGMNPALMYGSGASGGASAPIRTTQTPSWNPSPPDFGGVGRAASQGIESYYDIRMKDATLRQMEIQNRLLEEKIGTQHATTALTWTKANLTGAENAKLQMWLTDINQYNDSPVTANEVANGQYGSTDTPRNYNQEQAWLSVKNNWQNYVNKFDQNERNEILNSSTVDVLVARLSEIAQKNAESQERIKQIQENVKLLQKSGILKNFQISGEEFLNQKFSGTAGKGFLMLLEKALK